MKNIVLSIALILLIFSSLIASSCSSPAAANTVPPTSASETTTSEPVITEEIRVLTTEECETLMKEAKENKAWEKFSSGVMWMLEGKMPLTEELDGKRVRITGPVSTKEVSAGGKNGSIFIAFAASQIVYAQASRPNDDLWEAWQAIKTGDVVTIEGVFRGVVVPGSFESDRFHRCQHIDLEKICQ